MRKLRKLSLVWKMTFIMTLVLVAPMGVLCISYIQTFRLSASAELEDKLQTSLNEMQSNMEDSLDKAEAIFNELFYQLDFPYFLNYENKLSDKEIRHYMSNLQNQRHNIKYVYSNKYGNIGIYSSNKQIEEEGQAGQFYLDDLKKKAYYKEIVDGEGEIIYGACRPGELLSSNFDTSSLNLADEGRWVQPLYKRVYDLNGGGIVGVVELDIEIGKFSGIYSMGPEEEVINLVLAADGRALTGTKKITEEMAELIAGAVTKDEGRAEFVYKGEHFLMKYEKNSDNGLIKASVHSQERILTYINRKSQQIIITTLICLFILAVLTHYIMTGMLKRLVVLDRMMGKVGRGDFSVEITGNEEVEDEISRITGTFNKMASRLDQVMEEKVQDEKNKKDAELRALQAQINPHFLYNTLENMKMQCEIEEYDNLQNSLSALGDLFRYSISWGNNEAPFSKEWQNLLDYLNIMRMRFDEQLECVLDCEDGIGNIMVPKLILQPLVENSFNHGFKGKMPPWKLWVTAKRTDDCLVIEVRDNGLGVEEQRMEKLKNSLEQNEPFDNQEKQRKSIGVVNVKQRIELLCKKGSSFNIEDVEGGGVKVRIIIVS